MKNIASGAFAMLVFTASLWSQHTQQDCQGPPCSPDVIGFALPGWTITYQVTPGQGDGDEPCDPCKKCKAQLLWYYSGSDTFVVQHGDDFTVGGGPGSGAMTLKTDCDGTPDGGVFATTSGSFNVDLFCPCL